MNSTLMFKFLERGLQREFDVAACTRAKVQQQFAHIAVAFPYARVNLCSQLFNERRVSSRFAHLEAIAPAFSETLTTVQSNHALNAPGNFAPCGYGGLALQSTEPQVFHCRSKMRRKRF